MKKSWRLIQIAVLILCLTGCGKPLPADEALVVYSPHPLTFINPLVSEFEARTGIPVNVHTGGTGELLQMMEAGAEPRCDVIWGGSLSTISPKKELFEPYCSVNEDMIQNDFKNSEGNMTRFTDIPSVLMVNENLTGGLEITGYEDLLRPELKGKIAMCDPTTSSSAYEHLINMLYAMGEGDPEKGWFYVNALVENLDGKLLGGSAEVCQGVARGQYSVGLTFEEGAARYVSEDNAIRLVYMKEGVISKADAICIVKGTRRVEEARAFVDFMTGKDAQSVITGDLNRRSVRQDVEEPKYLPDKTTIHIIYDQEDVVNASKETWLARFSQLLDP